MKQLQESLLDDEDILMKKSDNAAETLKALKMINKAMNYSYSRKPGTDMFGRKLNRGDIVIKGDTVGGSFYMIHSIDPDESCTLVFNEENFYADANKFIMEDCEFLIKIDLKILEQIMKVK